MALADDMVAAVFERLCPPEDRPAYTADEIDGWRKDSALAVAAVMRTLAERRFVLANVLHGGHPLHPSLLAASVERRGAVERNTTDRRTT